MSSSSASKRRGGAPAGSDFSIFSRTIQLGILGRRRRGFVCGLISGVFIVVAALATFGIGFMESDTFSKFGNRHKLRLASGVHFDAAMKKTREGLPAHTVVIHREERTDMADVAVDNVGISDGERHVAWQAASSSAAAVIPPSSSNQAKTKAVAPVSSSASESAAPPQAPTPSGSKSGAAAVKPSASGTPAAATPSASGTAAASRTASGSSAATPSKTKSGTAAETRSRSHTPPNTPTPSVTPSSSEPPKPKYASLSPWPTALPLADSLSSAGHGSLINAGRRLWRVTREETLPFGPAACIPTAPALKLREVGATPEDRAWEYPVMRPWDGIEPPGDAAARLAAEEPALFDKYVWANETGDTLDPYFVGVTGPSLQVRAAEAMLGEASVRMFHLMAPLEGQASPYRWPIGLPSQAERVCAGLHDASITAPGYAAQDCVEAGRVPAQFLDRYPAGEGHPVDLLLPPWHAPLAVVTVSCGTVTSYARDIFAYYTLTPSALLSGSLGTKEHSLIDHTFKEDAEVVHLPAGASVGFSRYLGHPGHLPNEHLPRLLYLDAVVPKTITGDDGVEAPVPLIFPTPVPNAPHTVLADWFALLREAGAFKGRAFHHQGPVQHSLSVKKLFLLAPLPPEDDPRSPFVAYLPQNLMAGRMRRWALARLGRPLPAHTGGGKTMQDESWVPMPRHSRIVLLQRSGQRQIVNHDELLAALTARHPNVPIETFEPAVTPGYDLRTTLMAVANATLIVAPHGAGLNNLFAAAPGAAVVEIGPDSPRGFASTYNNLCLVTGLRYHWMLAPQTPDLKMTADVAGVLSLVARALGDEPAARLQSQRESVVSRPVGSRR